MCLVTLGFCGTDDQLQRLNHEFVLIRCPDNTNPFGETNLGGWAQGQWLLVQSHVGGYDAGDMSQLNPFCELTMGIKSVKQKQAFVQLLRSLVLAGDHEEEHEEVHRFAWDAYQVLFLTDPDSGHAVAGACP